jgi:uncharacterized phage-associated protein
MPFNSGTIANLFLGRAHDQGLSIDHMKLQKLVYIAHGWHLALTGNPLVIDRIEAWPYGPVLPELYREFKPYGARRIDGRSQAPPLEVAGTADEVANAVAIAQGVWDVYKVYSAVQLSAMTHQRGTPWDTVTKSAVGPSRGREIPDSVIREHYKILASRDDNASP